ncbi:uncharacterized protein LACBIDRAFT_256799, partial [Laccaria bicolor S238N-H82]
AGERTFLAYVRTSLGMASSGKRRPSLNRLGLLSFSWQSSYLSAIILSLGQLNLIGCSPLLIIGTRRHFAIQTALPRGQFPISRFIIAIVGFMIGSVITATFGMLLADRIRGS